MITDQIIGFAALIITGLCFIIIGAIVLYWPWDILGNRRRRDD